MFRSVLVLGCLSLVGCAPNSNNAGGSNIMSNYGQTDMNAGMVDMTAGLKDMNVSDEPSPKTKAGSEAKASPEVVEAAPSIPVYDTAAYCEKIGDTAGGSYSIEATCRSLEREAKADVESMSIPERTLNYCDRIGETAGGSYQIFKTCVEQESEAAASL